MHLFFLLKEVWFFIFVGKVPKAANFVWLLHRRNHCAGGSVLHRRNHYGGGSMP